MTFYWLIPFIAVLVLTSCNGAILASDKRDRVKYSLLYLNSFLLIWACLDILLWVNKTDDNFSLIILKLMSVFWLSIGFLHLNFVFSLLNKNKNLLYYLVLLSAVCLVLISVLTNKIIAGVQPVFWGVFPQLGDWILASVAIIILPMIYGLVLILKARKSVKDANTKRIYFVIVVATLSTIIIDSTVDIVLPVIFEVRLISMATLGNSFLSAVFLYIINKYRFLEISLEEFSKNIFDRVREGVIITTIDGEIVMQNNAASDLLIKNESDVKRIIEQNNSGETVIKSKVRETQSGESTYLNVSSNTLQSRDGRSLRLFLLNDVSDLVRFKNSLQDKNEEMRITLYRIGHDIKGPAFAIKQLISLSKEDAENTQDYLNKIEFSVDQLIRFNAEVEGLIRIKEIKLNKERVDLKKIIERCWEELDYFKQNGNHKLELDLAVENFISDPLMVYTIILNITSNAIKYNDIAKKGENNIKISSSGGNGKVEISIKDNGLGMDEVTLHNVFKLFYRGNTEISGAGLGMHLVKHAVEKLNGEIRVSSEPGKGTCFTIQLPIT